MSIQAQVALRSKKLGVLIRDARLTAHKSIPESAALIGVDSSLWESWEEGLTAPSLPELELLAYSLQKPLEQFWGKVAKSSEASGMDKMNLPAWIGIRQRLVGARLRQLRENSGTSLNEFSDKTRIPNSDLESYEMGEKPVPLPELEALLGYIGGQIEAFFDKTGMIGKWMEQQKTVQDFLQLPSELQGFITKPVNRPYLELALKLSNMSTEKLRSIAEDLLEITF